MYISLDSAYQYPQKYNAIIDIFCNTNSIKRDRWLIDLASKLPHQPCHLLLDSADLRLLLGQPPDVAYRFKSLSPHRLNFACADFSCKRAD